MTPGQSNTVNGDGAAFPAFLKLPLAHATLSLKTRQPDRLYQFDAPAPDHDAAWLKRAQAAYETAQITKPHTERTYFHSKLLTDFCKETTDIRTYILTPHGYDPNGAERYPAAFVM